MSQAFNVEGDFQMGRNRQHFTVQVVAENEDGAREHVFTDLGSRHGVPRRQVTITAVAAADASELNEFSKKRLR